jgi:hypothetical protein
VARAPSVISLEWLQAQCEQLERILRLQSDWGEVSAPYLIELESLAPDTTSSALRRWALLKHLYRVRDQGLRREVAPDPETAQQAVAELLRRIPVSMLLENGRTIRVTSRSFAAMIELAAHHARIRLLQVQLDEVAERYRSTLDRCASSHGRTRRVLRRRAGKLETVHRRLYTELHGHRMRLWANAMTESGSSAGLHEDPPEWWTETTPADDARLLVALYEAGPLRYRRLGPATEREDERKKKPAEDWGYEGLLVAWGVRKKVPPAEMLDQDLAQALTEMRLSAPPSLEEELDA